MIIIHVLSGAMILTGLVFSFGASVGFLRFPDFYSRVHAAGKGDTLSVLLILGGLALEALFYHGPSLATVLVAIKIMAVAGFIFVTSPTSSHALIQAGYEDGCEPVIEETPNEEKTADS